MTVDKRARLAERNVPPSSWSPRFRDAVELAAGERTWFRQQPTGFCIPGLPDIPFFDAASFDWTAAVEAAVPAIRAELDALLAAKADFRPYIADHVSPDTLGDNRALLGSKDWSVLFLCENGLLVPDAVARCPATWNMMLDTPLPRVAGWGPTVMFSVLKAGARIAPHTGTTNSRLICHLPLIVPPGCRFRVGNEVREWEVGKLTIFDDTIEHEAWNEGQADRVILIFDIWRPELSERERFELLAYLSD